MLTRLLFFMQAYFGPTGFGAPVDKDAPTTGVLSYFAGLGYICPPLTNPADYLIDMLFDQGDSPAAVPASGSQLQLQSAAAAVAPGASPPKRSRGPKNEVSHNDSCLPIEARKHALRLSVPPSRSIVGNNLQ